MNTEFKVGDTCTLLPSAGYPLTPMGFDQIVVNSIDNHGCGFYWKYYPANYEWAGKPEYYVRFKDIQHNKKPHNT